MSRRGRRAHKESVIDELTRYEKQRKPHEIVTDGRVTNVPVTSFNEEIRCPICLSVLQNTYTAMRCLHRFCYECIERSIRVGKKECPTCRAPLASRRALRRDEVFDQIIASVYPNREAYEDHQDELYELTRQASNRESLRQAMAEGLRQQADNRARRRNKSQPEVMQLGRNLDQEISVPLMVEPRVVEATLQVQLHSDDIELDHCYVNATPDITGADLKAFVMKDIAHHPKRPLDVSSDQLKLTFRAKPIQDATLLATLGAWSPTSKLDIHVSLLA